MRTPMQWFRSISLGAVFVLALGAQGAAAQPVSAPAAWPPAPEFPHGGSSVPPYCQERKSFLANTAHRAIAD
jgi:hypothetical protein